MKRRMIRCVFIALVTMAVSMPAQATWSIIVVDKESKEVAVGSATCLTRFNLKRKLPVVIVNVGGAAAQSRVDTGAINRGRIWDQLHAGIHPEHIIEYLATVDPDHQERQYGIVDTLGRAATFTGSGDGEWAGGVTGQVGSLVYAIQGNVLTGQPVVDQAEAALINTPGALPEKLMAAMEAAHDMGGDGRCSCDTFDPTGCGSPPPDFEKSAHCGFMVVARRGDVDGDCGDPRGCANGEYYLSKNIQQQLDGDPDPVIQLRERFDIWRSELIGVPDAVESTVTITPDRVLNDGVSTATLRIEVRDWTQAPAVGITEVAVEHDPWGSANSATIGALTDLGDGVYEATLTAGTIAGIDRIAVRVSDATGERYLIPTRKLVVQDQRADLNLDGVVDLADLNILLQAYGLGAGGDIDGDESTNLVDLAILLSAL